MHINTHIYIWKLNLKIYRYRKNAKSKNLIISNEYKRKIIHIRVGIKQKITNTIKRIS